MSDKYTPTTEDVRRAYQEYCWDYDAADGLATSHESYEEEFNRWHAKVRAEAQVEALREVAKDREWLDAAARTGMNEYGGPFAGNAAKGVRDYLYVRADRIAREAGIDSKGESK